MDRVARLGPWEGGFSIVSWPMAMIRSARRSLRGHSAFAEGAVPYTNWCRRRGTFSHLGREDGIWVRKNTNRQFRRAFRREAAGAQTDQRHVLAFQKSISGTIEREHGGRREFKCGMRRGPGK